MASARGSCRMARAFGAVLPLNWFGDASSRQPSNSSVGNGSESTGPTWGPRSLDGLEGVAEAGAALALRALIAGAYLALCAVGLVGNVLVLVLVRSQQRRRRSLLNCFLLNLAATDLQFVLTLPFWAVDVVRDFSWPFGGAMCKVVLTLTVLNMYASGFFLSAMSVARYYAVARALRPRRPGTLWAVCVCSLLWATAVLATAPTALFATAASIGGERLCLLRFPEGGPDWLAFYHLQKITVAFVLPVVTLGTCSLLLLRFLRRRRDRWPSGVRPRRRSRVTRALACVLLVFVLCWLPNQALTFWGVLIKLNAVPWDRAYFLVQAYLFPVSICLAHSNSCLNPLLYCLLRRDFRQGLQELCGRAKRPADLRPGSPTAAPQLQGSLIRPEPGEPHLSVRTTRRSISTKSDGAD
ncbi:relaxin-3 receptor 1-like [Moschus berezovskii]|uniref:relaxin-3 receptor 1-like n=1 Tax=Moschus berezovskii TaxID=68408 RepID=UPI002444F475|nr:relaxin-3 receptor 1-like [Moschus berezovskii]